MSDRIAIIGASGLLGGALVRQGEKLGLPCIRATNVADDLKNYALVDITKPDSLEFFFESWNPKVVINCAAYTKVDDAEDNYDACFDVNAVGVENLSHICKRNGTYLIHISTDYVFGGAQSADRERVPYIENEMTSPCGVYGWSKYFGERAVLSINPGNSLIVRTSWLHGIDGPSFLRSISKAAKATGKLNVVNDQFGSLTWAPWLAEKLIQLSQKKVTGILHACAEDTTNWFDVAKEYLMKAGIACELGPQSTEQSGRRAPRPRFSKMSSQSLAKILEEKIPSNSDFIDKFIEEAIL